MAECPFWAIGEAGCEEALNDRERRHSEVGAPVRQDLGSLRLWFKEHIQTPRDKDLSPGTWTGGHRSARTILEHD
jgi:hypothetical protein